MFDLSGKNVLVTGATGLLGRPLVDKLIERGAHVYGVGYEDKPKDWNDEAEYYSRDLADAEQVELLLAWLDDAEFIFHLAGAKGGVGIGRKRAADFMHGNMQSTINLLKALDKDQLPRLLFTSSVGAYPGDRYVFIEDEMEIGRPHESDYFGGYAKRFGEILFKAYREQYGLDYVVVRPTNCYGPYDRFDPETGMVIAALIARLEAGESPLRLWGDGNQRRDFLYSKDCAEGMIRAMERGVSGEAYNLGTGLALPLYNVLGALAEKYHFDPEYDATKPTGPKSRAMDMKKSFAAFGDFLRYNNVSGLYGGIAETVDWYRANRNYQKYDPFKK